MRGAVAALGLVLAGWPLAATGQSVIAPDVVAGRALGTTVGQTGTVFTIDGGTRAGNNLFHSFSQFDLAAGNTANWVRGAGDGASIANVVNRVTGGMPSTLAGTLDSTALPNAAFYFINPAGIVFGAGAQVNVPGAAHFSTAAELRFADGSRFAVATPNGSTLSVAAPESFGFVGGQGAIAIQGVGTAFAADTTRLSFTGSDIAMANADIAVGGIDLVAVGDGAGVVGLANPLAGAQVSGAQAGEVRFDDSTVRVRSGATAGAPLRVAGRALNLTLSNLFTESFGTGDGGDIRLLGSAVDLGGANIVTAAFGSGQAGDVHVNGDTIVISGGSLGSTPGGTRDSGSVSLTASQSLHGLGVVIGVYSTSAANAGEIRVSAPELLLQESLFDATSLADGAPGSVLIEARDVFFDEVFFNGDSKDGVGAQGLFRLRATGDVVLRDVFFSSQTYGLADGGIIQIEGRNIDLINSLILSEAEAGSFGDAGSVAVKATGDLYLSNTTVSSSTDGEGKAGDVRAEARGMTLEFESALRSDAFLNSTGDAGAVSVSADTLHVEGLSAISSETHLGATGDAGRVTIDAGNITLTTAGFISSTTRGPGAGGMVAIRADEILLAGERQGFTSIRSETLGEGRGGSIAIAARKLTLDGGGLISTVSGFNADAGDITLDVGEVAVLNGSGIAAVAGGAGKSGEITITADKLEVRSDERFDPSYISSAGVRGGGGDILLDVGSLVVDFSQISSDTTLEGKAGNVSIEADTVRLRNFGQISSSTQGFDDAGSIGIEARSLVLEEGTTVISAATPGSEGGNAGSISVAADSVVIGKGANLTTSTLSLGNAGRIEIKAKSMRVDGGFISSSAEIGSTGQAREVQITAGDLAIVNRGSIDTFSANPNTAGTVSIRAGTLRVDGLGSAISSENLAGDPVFTAPGPGGNAGTILIQADSVTISNGGRVSTNSFAGAAGDIDVAIRRPGLFVLEGGEFPGFIQTSSGPGTGGRIVISDPLAVISNGGLILALGQQRGANVQIQSRYFIESTDRRNVVSVDGEFQIQTGLYDVSSGTVSRDLSVLDASRVLRGQCPAARSAGAVSQLITRPVGPYAREPAIDAPREASPGGCP